MNTIDLPCIPGHKIRFLYELCLHGVLDVLEEDPQAIIGAIGEGQVAICIPQKYHTNKFGWFPADPVAIGTMEDAENFVLGLLGYYEQFPCVIRAMQRIAASKRLRR